jgi:hypothetical protein
MIGQDHLGTCRESVRFTTTKCIAMRTEEHQREWRCEKIKMTRWVPTLTRLQPVHSGCIHPSPHWACVGVVPTPRSSLTSFQGVVAFVWVGLRPGLCLPEEDDSDGNAQLPTYLVPYRVRAAAASYNHVNTRPNPLTWYWVGATIYPSFYTLHA